MHKVNQALADMGVTDPSPVDVDGTLLKSNRYLMQVSEREAPRRESKAARRLRRRSVRLQ